MLGFTKEGTSTILTFFGKASIGLININIPINYNLSIQNNPVMK